MRPAPSAKPVASSSGAAVLLVVIATLAAGGAGSTSSTAASSGRRVLVQVVYGKGVPMEVLVTSDMLHRFGTRCEHLVLTDNATVSRLPWFISALKSRGVTVAELPDTLADLAEFGVKVEPDVVATLEGNAYLRKLGLFKAPTLSPGDVMAVLDSDAIPVGNIDSLFDYPTAAMPFWAVPDPHPTHQLNSGVMAIYVYDRLYEDFLKTLGEVGLLLGDGDQDLINYHMYMNVPFKRTALPGLYGTSATQLFGGAGALGDARSADGVVLSNSTEHWGHYLQVVHYTMGRLERHCRRAVKFRHRKTDPCTPVLRRHCCSMAGVLRSTLASDGAPSGAKAANFSRTFDGYCDYFNGVMGDAGD